MEMMVIAIPFLKIPFLLLNRRVVDILLPDEIECLGLTIDFTGAMQM